MISLSIYTGHNASACVMKDGEILLNWELERFTRIKHDYGYNQDFIDKTLDHCELTMDDIDVILINREPWEGPLRQAPWKVPTVVEKESVKFTIDGKEAHVINHHLCHVASAYYTSKFSTATIITYDAGANYSRFSYAEARENKITLFKAQLTNRDSSPIDAGAKDVASWWSGITMNNYRMPRIHEVDPGSGAGKIMALAAYGKTNPNLEKKLEKDFELGHQAHYTDWWQKCAYNDDQDLSDTTSEISQNVAAALQSITQKELSKQYQHIYEKHPNENLCIAGGIALNCVANSEVKSNFKNLHCPPFPNDTGQAIGMALYHWHHILDNPKLNDFFVPYLGPEYKDEEVLDLLKEYDYEPVTVENLTEVLCNRDVVCVARGRSESGPRALGHRSILCVPDTKYGRDYLNEKIKKREWYRPYAPIILDHAVEEVLEQQVASPYMTMSATIKEEWRERLDAVNHVDNSTRPQVIKYEQEPFIYEVLERVYEKTGIPVLLNTSFNLQEPIVETPQEALKTFTEFGLDYLVLHNYLVKRKGL